ncbi:hypothetical protein GIB67_020204 [Kingdonia uniflora]|uniref:NmrA-like domain-containing protein n=1 Tax=Kingdonia uniflora TaxID=39325 RepID=A0A7J7NUI6_9MAGN|nr:hypothetical protein GIB67_020204 [Kingdonia uniflora]
MKFLCCILEELSLRSLEREKEMEEIETWRGNNCGSDDFIGVKVSTPMWRLYYNMCNSLVFLPHGAHRLSTTKNRCPECDSTILEVDFKKNTTPLSNRATLHVGCILCDELLHSHMEIKHGISFFKHMRGRGRGRGRGGSRGKGRGVVYVDEDDIAAYAISTIDDPHTLNMLQMGTLLPSREQVSLYRDSNVKAAYDDEDNITTYVISTIDNPRTLNRTVYIRPPKNVISQRELVGIWEGLINKELQKLSISAMLRFELVMIDRSSSWLSNLEIQTGQDYNSSSSKKIDDEEKDTMNLTEEVSSDEALLLSCDDVNESWIVDSGQDYAGQLGIGHFYHIFYEGCLTNFEVGEA